MCCLQREVYDKTGKVQLSVEEQLRQSFGRGDTLHRAIHIILPVMPRVLVCLHTQPEVAVAAIIILSTGCLNKLSFCVCEPFQPIYHCSAGNFRDSAAQPNLNVATLSEQITIRQSPIEQSHTAGFDVSPC